MAKLRKAQGEKKKNIISSRRNRKREAAEVSINTLQKRVQRSTSTYNVLPQQKLKFK